MMAVAVALFIGGVAMGLAGALMWAWAVRTGQLRDLERSKHQIFWPDIADPESVHATTGSRDTQDARRT